MGGKTYNRKTTVVAAAICPSPLSAHRSVIYALMMMMIIPLPHYETFARFFFPGRAK